MFKQRLESIIHSSRWIVLFFKFVQSLNSESGHEYAQVMIELISIFIIFLDAFQSIFPSTVVIVFGIAIKTTLVFVSGAYTTGSVNPNLSKSNDYFPKTMTVSFDAVNPAQIVSKYSLDCFI